MAAQCKRSQGRSSTCFFFCKILTSPDFYHLLSIVKVRKEGRKEEAEEKRNSCCCLVRAENFKQKKEEEIKNASYTFFTAVRMSLRKLSTKQQGWWKERWYFTKKVFEIRIPSSRLHAWRNVKESTDDDCQRNNKLFKKILQGARTHARTHRTAPIASTFHCFFL